VKPLLATLALLALTAQVPTPVPSAQPTAEPTVSPTATPATPGTLVATPASVAMPPNGAARVTIAGATGALAVTVAQNLVTADVDPAAPVIRIFASDKTGTDTVHVVDADGASLDIPVRVAPYGGILAGSVSVDVTGDPADPAFVADKVRDAVRRATQVQPGATLTIGAPDPAPASLASGASVALVVPVQIAGGDAYLDVAGSTAVTVQNMALGGFEPALLHYDDDPERVGADGLLYRATVSSDRPIRLYYYHDSDAARHRFLMVLASQSDQATPVHVIAATGGPNVDVMSVGHAVSRNFVLTKLHDQGVVLDLPQSGTNYTLLDVPFGGGEGVAGTVDLRVLGGGPVDVLLLSVPADADDATVRQMLFSARLPSDGHRRTGAFRIDGYGSAERSYAVGGADVSVVYGDQGPPSADDTAGRDAGDYGVVQSIGFSLNNPTAAPAVAYLYERPIGGSVRSTFVVDGTAIELGCVRDSAQRYLIAAYTLAAHANRDLLVKTMTDGGSNYPIEVGVSATPPVATTPPLADPDGCFPAPATPAPSASPMPSPSPPPL